MIRRVGAGIDRSVGITAVGKTSAIRNESGKPNDTDWTLPLIKGLSGETSSKG